MATIEEIIIFIEKIQDINKAKIHPNSDLSSDLGIEGDDFFELEEQFAKQFNVDMSGYLWYFHHGEEGGFHLGGIFFKPPYKRVSHIPVTPLVLLEAANHRKWPIKYPDHHLPAKRYDIYINLYIAVLIILLGALLALYNFLTRQ